MKTTIKIFMILALLGAGQLKAQSLLDAASAVGSGSDIGSMIGKLADGIKPEAFSKAWKKNKTEWMNKLKNVKVDDIATYGKMAGELVSNLKSSAFLKGFDIKDLTKSLGSANSTGSLAGALSSLTKGLDKKVLTDDFAKNVDTYTAGLDMMSKMK